MMRSDLRGFKSGEIIGLTLAGVVLLSIALGSLPGSAKAQSLEPRAYANAPVGLNFLILGYAYQQGDVLLDPSVPLKDTSAEIHYSVLPYVRSLDVWGRSGKIDMVIPYAWLSGKAKVEEEGRSRRVSRFLKNSPNGVGCGSMTAPVSVSGPHIATMFGPMILWRIVHTTDGQSTC